MNSRTMKVITALAVVLFMAAATGCTKDGGGQSKPPQPSDFIPQKNKKYVYKVETDNGSPATATQYISGQEDSSGITIYNLRTEIKAKGETITLNDKIFSTGGKTYTEIKVPDAWYQTVTMLGLMPDVKVTKAEVFGYPAYLTMENVLKEGSKIAASGPDEQGQRIEYAIGGQPASVVQYMRQVPGTATVETVKVAAGSFICSKFVYKVVTLIETKYGEAQNNSYGNDDITLWVAHGIGVVKQESKSDLMSFVPLPTGEIRIVTTNTASVTTLQNIN
ncbi:MAG: hypothetical protein QM768_22590 [Agriterribacter sp.]